MLAGQPDFQIVGSGGGKACVAGAEEHAAVWQVQRFQYHFGAARHALVLGVAVVGMGDGYKFDFAELMLAQHAARVPPGAAGFASETIG